MKTSLIISVLITSYLFFNPYIVAQEQKKNIVFIMVDDLKPSIRSFGDKTAITPNIDKLAKKSSIFTNNHVQVATCSPSRISYLTGKRPDYTKSYHLETSMREMRPNIVTLPQYFKENGYTTVGIGKLFDSRSVDKLNDRVSWHKFYSPYTRSFNKNYPKPRFGYQDDKKRRIIDSMLAVNFPNGTGKTNIYKWFKRKYKPPYSSSPKPDDVYKDGATAQFAVKALDTIGKNGKPFFFAIGFSKPHIPFVAPEKYWNYYEKENIQLAPYQKNAKNTSQYFYHNSGELQGHTTPEISYSTSSNGNVFVEDHIQKNLVHGYYACVSFIDAQIGKIVDKLSQTGLIENTIIVIWGDHGYHLGDHSVWNKHTVLEQATRAPLLIYDPSLKKSQKISTPIESIDVFPTLLDLAGLEKLDSLDGTSLENSMIKGKSNKKYAVSQFNMFRGKNLMAYAFRTKEHRYIMIINKLKIGSQIFEKDILHEALFDYKNDPLETQSFIGNQKFTKIESEMKNYAISFLNKYYNKI